jgi:galactokinase
MGAGLSSSAALECGVGFAMNSMFNLGLSKKELALIGQKSEHTFVGCKLWNYGPICICFWQEKQGNKIGLQYFRLRIP